MNGFDLLTVTEVCELLHISKAHASNLISGRVRGCAAIPAVRLGRRKLVRRAALIAWIEENERAPSPAMIPVSPERGARKHA
jgi:excisionase family DNA binding protein